MKIVISSNCQTGPIAQCLRIMLPQCEIYALPITKFNTENKDYTDAISQISNANVWLHWDRYLTKNHLDRILVDSNNPQLILHKLPAVRFEAFHPDLVYLTNNDNGSVLKTSLDDDYHSSIAYCAFISGYDLSKTASLFNPDIFQLLGFYNKWDLEIRNLTSELSYCGIEVTEFINDLQMLGVFMHTINHPKINVITKIAKHYAILLGASSHIADIPIENFIEDPLLHIGAWPVYPFVGENLGLIGSYLWRVKDTYFLNLESYLEYLFKGYENKDLTKYSMHNRDVNHFSSILGENFGK
jgi:hypothetical protein